MLCDYLFVSFALFSQLLLKILGQLIVGLAFRRGDRGLLFQMRGFFFSLVVGDSGHV